MINLIQNLDAPHLVKHMPFYLVFKTTNYCWFKCPHCCENAGPHQEKTYIPQEVIYFYLNQALQDSRFKRSIVLTGGEIFSSYVFGDKQYIPNILNFTAQNDIITDIKTNAAWANTKFSKEIFKDLKKTIVHRTQQKLPMVQMSLSLDKYHTNCFDNDFKIIKELSDNPILFNISSFEDSLDLVENLKKKLSKNFRLGTVGILHEDGTFVRNRFFTLKGTTSLIQFGCGTLFKNGRANNLDNAEQLEYPQFTFCSSDGILAMAFDSFGNVTLGENSGRKIKTPWRDKNGNLKPLSQIQQELYINCWKELAYTVFHKPPYTR